MNCRCCNLSEEKCLYGELEKKLLTNIPKERVEELALQAQNAAINCCGHCCNLPCRTLTGEIKMVLESYAAERTEELRSEIKELNDALDHSDDDFHHALDELGVPPNKIGAPNCYDGSISRLKVLGEEIQRLREALEEYGIHKVGCNANGCTCGFDAAFDERGGGEIDD